MTVPSVPITLRDWVTISADGPGGCILYSIPCELEYYKSDRRQICILAISKVCYQANLHSRYTITSEYMRVLAFKQGYISVFLNMHSRIGIPSE
jgi:hypothetical protein